MISRAAIEEIRAAVPISAIVGRYAELRPAGRSLKALCPLHSEKTASFSVDDAEGFFFCFGCGAGGDVFEFLKLADGLDFPAAVHRVADHGGYSVDDDHRRPPLPAATTRRIATRAKGRSLMEWCNSRFRALARERDNIEENIEFWREHAASFRAAGLSRLAGDHFLRAFRELYNRQAWLSYALDLLIEGDPEEMAGLYRTRAL